MKNLYIQSLVLAVTMVMVYTSTVGKRNMTKAEMLLFIEGQVNITLKESNELNQTIIKVSGNRTHCPKEFFCFAEKALNMTKLPLNNPALFWSIHEFNNMTNHTHCHLKKNITCTVELFLKDIRTCAQTRK